MMSLKESVPAQKSNYKTVKSKRRTWQNCVCNQTVEPLGLFKPRTLEELTSIICDAKRNNCKVKAVGSGHSFSDVVQTSDYLINCHFLDRAIVLDESLLKDEISLNENGCSRKYLVHVENGMTIRMLNDYLDKKTLALINMGGYDGQTIAGVLSTSTHGTGISLGPMASSVVSLILVSETGKIYRIEPSSGITDRKKYKFRFPENCLIQNDAYFNAVLVSMGCMGIIYSVILKVTDHYNLKEERYGRTQETYWEDLKQNGNITKLLHDNRHLEIWVNPYAIRCKHNCLVTRINKYEGNIYQLSFGERSRKWIIENLLLKFRKLPMLVFKLFYRKTPQLITAAMKGVLDYDGYVNKSYKVMHLGNANYVKGYAAEYAVSLENNLHIAAVDAILELAEKNKVLGELYHTAPISLRFVKKCDAFLSMMNGEDKCLIEVPLLVGTKGRFQILDKIEHRLHQLGKIRPHWGQYHNLNEETIRELYPELDKWLKVYREFNQTGMFNNTFTDRCGFK